MALPRGIIERGQSLAVRFREPASGLWRTRTTGIKKDAPGAIAAAVAIRDRIEAALAAGAEINGALTVARWAETWFDERDNPNKHNELAIFKTYIKPRLGGKILNDVTPNDVQLWVKYLKSLNKASSTIHHIYNVASGMFALAEARGLVSRTPFHRRFDGLPPKGDKVKGWREKAVFSVEEVRELLSNERIPLRSRAANGVLFLAGLRAGELAALRWNALRPREPLADLFVHLGFDSRRRKLKTTKEDKDRHIPVHPVLAELLAAWRIEWAFEFRREPTEDDLMFPATAGKYKGRGAWTAFRQRRCFLYWLEKVGLRIRRLHDTRRTFVSMYLDAGAPKDRLKWIKDGRPDSGDSIDDYDQAGWQSLCDCILKIDLRLTKPTEAPAVRLRGFAALDPEQRRAIAARGGKAIQASGVAHRFNHFEAVQAGCLGGHAKAAPKTCDELGVVSVPDCNEQECILTAPLAESRNPLHVPLQLRRDLRVEPCETVQNRMIRNQEVLENIDESWRALQESNLWPSAPEAGSQVKNTPHNQQDRSPYTYVVTAVVTSEPEAPVVAATPAVPPPLPARIQPVTAVVADLPIPPPPLPSAARPVSGWHEMPRVEAHAPTGPVATFDDMLSDLRAELEGE